MTRILATHIFSTSTQIDQCMDYRISYYVMSTYYCYTCMSCLHITVTPACHVYIALLHVHVMLTYHCYTCMSYFPVTHAYMVSLYSCHMDHHAYYMYYYSMFPYSCYMIDSCYNNMDIPDTGHESC